MVIYRIPMQLRYAENGTDYADFEGQFEIARKAFNLEAEKRKKARQIQKIEITQNGFDVILESVDSLTTPSKALAVFSRELAKMPEFEKYLDAEKHLLASNGLPQLMESGKKEFDGSTAMILRTVIDIFLDESPRDNVFEIAVRKDARKEITEICRKFVEAGESSAVL